MIDPFLTQIISETRALALSYWREGFAVETKPDRTLVTEADKAIERLFRDRLQALFPNDGILGEEYGTRQLDADRIWIIDPIDGTQAFVMGIPVFSTLIACMQGGKITQAVADFPAMDLMFSAQIGQGAFVNDNRVRVSDCTDLNTAVLTATSTTMFRGEGDARRFDQLIHRVGSMRFGLDAYGFCSLARGRADMALEACLKPYDYLAPSLIVTEAGGQMTDWRGAPLGIEGDGRVLATATPTLHQQALQLLS